MSKISSKIRPMISVTARNDKIAQSLSICYVWLKVYGSVGDYQVRVVVALD